MADTHVEEQVIGKITISQIGCKPVAVKLLPDGQNELPIARLYGTLDDVREQFDKDKGITYTYFAGTFEAINMQDGDVFKSGKMFLPKGISELVEKAVKDAKGGDEKRQVNIDFAFEVRAVKANNPAGYSYKVLPLVSPEQSDRLKQLREKVFKAGTIDVKRLTGNQRGSGPTTIEGTTKKSA